MRALLLCSLAMIINFTAMAQDDAKEERELLGRRHNVQLGLKYNSATQEETDITQIRAEVAYRHNFGYIEPGFQYAFRSYKSDPGFPNEDASYTLSVRGNFIKNEPGKNFIPYAEVGITGVANETENSLAYTTISGRPISYGAGFLIYPFGEIFAFDIALMGKSGEFEQVTEDSITSAETEFAFDESSFELRVGYTLSFE